MVKFYQTSFTYDYSFPAVTLAYFLRYPNPFATHVLSTDVIDRRFDPETQRLYTTRLHLKRSKLPSALLKLLPSSLLGATAAGSTQSFILEQSVVDVKEGWMETESKNLEFTGVLSVQEHQMYRRRPADVVLRENFKDRLLNTKASLSEQVKNGKTDVTTTVTLHSHLGQGRRLRNRFKSETDEVHTGADGAGDEDATQPRMGFFKSWTTSKLQLSIERIGLTRTERSQPNAKEGMKVVLERLRQGGLVAVLEGMRRDSEAGFGSEGPFKRSFRGSPGGVVDDDG